MSRDIFVQDIPDSVTSVDEIPDDWLPQPLRFTPSEVIDSIKVHAPDVDQSDPAWVRISDAGIEIELNIDSETPFMAFAFHDRSTDRDASDRFIARVLSDLGARAFDPEGSETGIFTPPGS